MDNVCFLYYRKKENRHQKDMRRRQPSFYYTGKWPIFPHSGGVKWVTHLLSTVSAINLCQVTIINVLVI